MHSSTIAPTRLMKRLWLTEPRLTAVGVSMFLVLAATGLALLFDAREIGGAPAWMKPAKFAASIGIYTLTLAWVFTYLQEWVKTRRIVSWISTVVFIVEIVIIDLQAWRGTTSHFNVGTVLDGVMFTVMGLAIVVQTLSAVAVAVALWRQNFSDRAMGWALRLGMTITIVGAMSGGLMTRPTQMQLEAARAGRRMTTAGAHTVGAPDGGPGLPVAGWSRDHGDLRVAHFVGLHALQMLPVLTFICERRGWSEARRVRMTLAAAGSSITLFSLLMWQALRGQSIIRPDETTLTAMALWIAITGASIWATSYRSDAARAHAIVY